MRKEGARRSRRGTGSVLEEGASYIKKKKTKKRRSQGGAGRGRGREVIWAMGRLTIDIYEYDQRVRVQTGSRVDGHGRRGGARLLAIGLLVFSGIGILVLEGFRKKGVGEKGRREGSSFEEAGRGNILITARCT